MRNIPYSSSGRHFALIVTSEGVNGENEGREKYIGDYLQNRILEQVSHLCDINDPAFCGITSLDIRATTLGHLQRSGTPLSLDRVLATVYGIKGVELIEEEKYDQVVVWREGQVTSLPLKPIIKIIKQCHAEKRCAFPVDPNGFMVKTARSLEIYLGES